MNTNPPHSQESSQAGQVIADLINDMRDLASNAGFLQSVVHVGLEKTSWSPAPAFPNHPATRKDHPMSTITVKNPAPATTPPQSMPAVNTTHRQTRTRLHFVELGIILLKDEDQTPWMSLRKISGQCIKHWVKLPRLNYSIRYLSDWANEFFPKSGEIRGDRVKVIYKTEPSESKRPPDLYIQFCKVSPDGSCN